MTDDDIKDPEELETDEAPAVEAVAGRGGSVPGALGMDDPLGELMDSNFLEYAAYVIKDRAIPDVYDGLKPVQRRILHSLWKMDDGRFHKVANVIGQTMQYHPHGDASIGDALVVLANKEYFIDRQGNFGNIHTGDSASAARYIECRLTPLAHEILFNPDITEFVPSYDGRNQEPVSLPAKLPVVLMLGAEGIAVGLSTSILPHNFNELIDAQVAILEGSPFECFPDFLTGGIMDVSDYDDGAGRVRVRAHIDKADDKTLVIREVPAGVSTDALMEDIEKAVKSGKIKIAAINDYTAEKVEIEIKLPRGIHADEAIRQLYAYTKCEVSVTSNIVVIHGRNPRVMTVSEILRLVTERLVDNLGRELEIELKQLQERFHEKTLAQLFIENRVYQLIEECETSEAVHVAVRTGLAPFQERLAREITEADIERLLELSIRRISRFDINRNRREIDEILKALSTAWHNLRHLVPYAIRYLKGVKQKYGKSFPRHTRIEVFAAVNAREVALQNLKVHHDRSGQFIGTSVKSSSKDAEPLVCTEFDRLALFRNDGVFRVIPVQDKVFVGPIKEWFKADKRQVYSMLYREKKGGGRWFAKRFRVAGYIMNKEYPTIPKGCIVEAVYDKYNVVARLELEDTRRAKDEVLELDFNAIELRSPGARGFKIADRGVTRMTLIKRGTDEPPEELEAMLAAAAAKSTAALAVEAEENDDADDENIAGEAEEVAAPVNAAVLEIAALWRLRADQVVHVIEHFLPLPSSGAASAVAGPADEPAAPSSPTRSSEPPPPPLATRSASRRGGKGATAPAASAEPLPPPARAKHEKPPPPARAKHEKPAPPPARAKHEKAPLPSAKPEPPQPPTRAKHEKTPPPASARPEKVEEKTAARPVPRPRPRKLVDEDGDFFLS
jgi:topoisomerase-4 subunit A